MIAIVPYDPAWPREFERERDRLEAGLGGMALRIEHNGSTAVPGLAAKPVIDIQISVARLQPLLAYAAPLARLGYVHAASADDVRCPFFHLPADWPHTHHVHVVEAGGEEERQPLASRASLRAHPDGAREYEALRRARAGALGGAEAGGREAYATAKSDFVMRTAALTRLRTAG